MEVIPTIEYKYLATKYANTNPEYRQKVRQWSRESAARQRARDPAADNEKKRNYLREKYNNDPEYRQRKIAQNKAYQERKKLERATLIP